MKWWIVIVAVMGLAACKVTETAPAPTVEATPEVTESSEDWAHVDSDGVRLDVRTPVGWQAIPNEYGILLTEHAGLDGPDTSPLEGILIFIFVPKLDDIDMDTLEGSNFAWGVLSQ